MQEPRIPDEGVSLWSGRACDAHWTVTFAGVAQCDDDANDDELSASVVTWLLLFRSDAGEAFRRSWSPDEHILFGVLPGWSSHVVGQLKRSLIDWTP